jgi:Major intrinsic protein
VVSQVQVDRPGLFGSRIGTNMLAAAAAEAVGTFILVYGGTAVAVAALLDRPVAGPAYNSVATPLAFGLSLLMVVASIGHVSGGRRPAVTLGLALPADSRGATSPPTQLVGGVLGALAPGRPSATPAVTTPTSPPPFPDPLSAAVKDCSSKRWSPSRSCSSWSP